MNRRSFLGASAATLGAAAFTTVSAVPGMSAQPKPTIGAFGVDLDARDLSVKPGDNFFNHVNGSWLKNTQIPADRTRWGSFNILADKAERDVRAIIEELAGRQSAAGSVEQKIGDFYRSFMDTNAIEAAGLAPLKSDLARIAAANDHDAIAKLMAVPDLLVNGPITAGVGLDDGNPDRYIINIGQGGLHLPEREYYLKDDARMGELRTKYKAHVARLLGLAGQSDAAAKADLIFALETEMAKRHLPIEDMRDSTKMYNPKKRADVKALAPGFPWDAAFGACGLDTVEELWMFRFCKKVRKYVVNLLY